MLSRERKPAVHCYVYSTDSCTVKHWPPFIFRGVLNSHVVLCFFPHLIFRRAKNTSIPRLCQLMISLLVC